MSEKVPVISGVPPGTVAGQTLFLIFIDNIEDNISSTLKLFADDCLLYREVSTIEDAKTLKDDINKLHEWSRT